MCNRSYEGGLDWVVVDDLEFGVHELNCVLRVGFRGSWNWKNWLRDIYIREVYTPNGLSIHAGFEGAFQKIWPVLAPMIKGRKVISYGHSLGAALALRLGEQVHCEEVITFACPKVYTQPKFGPNITHTRVINEGDPVPNLPAWPYGHSCTRLILLASPTGNKVNPEYHNIGAYIDRIEKEGM